MLDKRLALLGRVKCTQAVLAGRFVAPAFCISRHVTPFIKYWRNFAHGLVRELESLSFFNPETYTALWGSQDPKKLPVQGKLISVGINISIAAEIDSISNVELFRVET